MLPLCKTLDLPQGNILLEMLSTLLYVQLLVKKQYRGISSNVACKIELEKGIFP